MAAVVLAPTADRRRFVRRVALVPACLCVVALLHVYRVYWHDQTPWKGGGFGMFSTIDERAARYLRCYLVTADGEIPVAIPSRWEKRVTVLRAAPNQSQLDELAADLAAQPWRDARQHWEAIAVGLAMQSGPRPVEAGDLHPSGLRPEIPSPPFGSPLEVEPAAGSDPAGPRLAVQSVRVELWRFEYDSATRRLRGRKSLAAEAATQGDA
ncbi:MAG: hypothetical protein J5I93_22870 [Pirellulaceae bacterium]|nr:hypothetical protein [Pirellulaceae bacterium]